MNQDNILRVVLFRHGQTISNIEKRLQYLEDPLTEEGKKQVEEKIDELKGFNFDELISSDELRAIESAEIINKNLNIPFSQTPLIREKSSGDFSKKLVGEVDWSLVTGPFLTKKIPNGESALDVVDRALDFLKLLNNKEQGKEILVVSHGTFLRVLYSVLFNSNLQDLLLNYKFPNADFLVITRNEEGEWKIEKSCVSKK